MAAQSRMLNPNLNGDDPTLNVSEWLTQRMTNAANKVGSTAEGYIADIATLHPELVTGDPAVDFPARRMVYPKLA